jgi:uncharacterized protein with GYD domain
MANYVMLATYTEQGLRTIQDTVSRADQVKAMAEKAGLKMKETYWVMGAYDVVAVFEAPDDETMTGFALSVAKLGNVKTQTLRAFTPTEMKSVLGKVKQ